jgi:hypothetical protein
LGNSVSPSRLLASFRPISTRRARSPKLATVRMLGGCPLQGGPAVRVPSSEAPSAIGDTVGARRVKGPPCTS